MCVVFCLKQFIIVWYNLWGFFFSVFASSEPVPGFQGDTLQLAFIDLRQVNYLTELH